MDYKSTSEIRFYALLKAIENEQPCRNRQQAHDLLLKHWISVCQRFNFPTRLLNRMHYRNICAEHGWKNVEKNPCYWDSNTSPGVRIYLHDDGRIVMQRINDGVKNEILYFK